MVTVADVKALGSELDALDDTVVQAAIDAAETELNEDILGERFDLAVKYLAAHEAKLRAPGGASGTVQSVSVGGVSRSYSSGSSTESDFDRTSYGQRFLRIIENTSTARFFVA